MRINGPISIQLLVQSVLPLLPTTIRPLPGLYVCLYDFLIDDDVEVREAAAKATSLLLSSEPKTASSSVLQQRNPSLNPATAALELLNAVALVHQSSIIVWLESVRRLTGVDDSLSTRAKLVSLSSTLTEDTGVLDQSVPELPLALRPFADILLETKQINDETFAVEKQNLYVDDIQEARRWTELLTKLRPGHRAHTKAAEVVSWLHDGLATLMREIQEDKASSRSSPPSPVDWMEEPDAMTVIIRLALVTRVQAAWHDAGVLVDEAALIRLRKEWKEVVEAGAGRLHPLVVCEVRRSCFFGE